MQRERHRDIGVIHYFQTPRNTAFDRATETIANACRHVSNPRGHHARNAACADQLVEENIGNGADESEVAAALANEFMAGGERNHLLELRAEKHNGARWNMARDGVA